MEDDFLLEDEDDQKTIGQLNWIMWTDTAVQRFTWLTDIAV